MVLAAIQTIGRGSGVGEERPGRFLRPVFAGTKMGQKRGAKIFIFLTKVILR